MQGLLGLSFSPQFLDFWKKLWKANVPGKVKVHAWKVCSDILPTVSRLRSRRVHIDDGCYFCNYESETIAHICRDCPFVHSFLRSFAELRSLPSVLSPSVSAFLWLVSCSEVLANDDFAFLLFALWSIWKQRNQRVWHNISLPLERLTLLTQSQFQLASSFGFPTKLPRVSRVHCPWKPPPLGWLKCNADGAFDKVTQTWGVGVVVWDSNGVVVGGACLKLSHISSPELIEALASRAACELAIQFSLTPILFEADSLLVVQATKCLDPYTSSVGRVYEDIVGYLKNLPGSSFSHVYRASNIAAHKLAKLALTSSLQVFWSGNAPPEVSSFVATSL